MSVLHQAKTPLSLPALAETCRGCYELISQACKRAEVVRSNERRRPFESACMAGLLEKVATPAASCLLMPSSVATYPRNASAWLRVQSELTCARAMRRSLLLAAPVHMQSRNHSVPSCIGSRRMRAFARSR